MVFIMKKEDFEYPDCLPCGSAGFCCDEGIKKEPENRSGSRINLQKTSAYGTATGM
jgi:hypothetical protein